jgi:hypothetical protein
MSDNIWQATAQDREDGTYLFDERADAEAFAEAVTRKDDPFAPGVEDTPVNRGEEAGALIAAERGDRIEEVGMPSVAEDVREGIDLSRVLVRLAAIGEHRSEAAALLRAWRDEESRRAEAGTTYTVVGVYAEDGQRFGEVFEAIDPGAAEDQAEAWADEQVGSPEIIIAAVLAGAPTLVDEVA